MDVYFVLLMEIKVMKQCPVCKKTKQESEYYKAASRSDGLNWQCKECAKAYRKKTQPRHNELRNARYHNDKEYREEQKVKKRADYWNNKERGMLSNARNKAKRRGLPFNLELEDIKIPQVCPILGVPIDRGRYSASLDKIIPEKGYVKGNVQVISKLANTMKNDASFEELKLFSENILTYIKYDEDIVRTAEKSVEVEDKEPL